MESKFIRILSIVATITAVCMYVAYIDQIQKTWAMLPVHGYNHW